MANTDLGPDRRQRILDAVRDRGTVRVRDLADELDVSLMTVRRDIGALADEGLLERIHGGARLRGGKVAAELLPAVKGLLNPEGKKSIAKAAAQLIQPGEVVGIGAGTTALALAAELTQVADLTVATNSVPVAQVFWTESTARVILTGGEVTPSQALVGPIAMLAVERLHLDTVVLGTHGLDLEVGCTTPNLLEAQVNTAMLQAARRSVVLADSQKWGVVGLTTFADLEDIDVLVSDDGLPPSAVSALGDQGIEVIAAPASAG